MEKLKSIVGFNCTENKYKIKEITYLWRDNKDSITRSGDKPFFFKGWKYYINSQVEGLLKIIEINNKVNPGTLGVTLNLIYSYWMIAKYLNLIDDEIKECLSRLKNNPQLLTSIKDEAFWEYVSQNIKGCQMWEDHLIFYQDRFNDWLKEYIAEEL